MTTHDQRQNSSPPVAGRQAVSHTTPAQRESTANHMIDQVTEGGTTKRGASWGTARGLLSDTVELHQT